MTRIPLRRALVIALAGVLAACARPASAPEPTPFTPQAAPTSPPALPAPTPPATALKPSPAAASPAAGPTPTPVGDVALDVRLWNGEAEVHLDGRMIQPGRHQVPEGTHEIAALVDGDIAAIVKAPPGGGTVDLIVPPPQPGLAIMIENQEDARPQTGLGEADVVYEALAEGGITRFIALYLTADAAIVGPVRSLRHYFAFMAGDYGADVVHIGASPEGFAWRDAMNMGHLDESAGDPGVWRVRTRPPPHNAYTNTAADRALLSAQGRQQNRLWGPLLFNPQAPKGAEVAENISLGFLPWPYRVGYSWDAGQGRYLRSMDGTAHLDAATGAPIAPATVVVQFTEVEAVANDPKLRLDMNLAGGSGQLVVFSDGTRREGTWTKASSRSPTRWLDPHGEPITIPPGPVWVEVLPLNSPLNSN